MLSGLLNWVKGIISSKDDDLIGISQLRERRKPLRNTDIKETLKRKKDIKISDLIKGQVR